MQTVAQLIEALKAFPPETRVIVEGYEGGFDNVATPKLQEIAHKGRTAYCGEFADASFYRSTGDEGPFETCVLLAAV